LLAAVWITGIGVQKTLGAHRWIYVGFTLQPSELMKFAMAVFLAKKLSETIEAGRIGNGWDGFVKPLIPVAFVFVIIVMQPNYSMALLLLLMAFVMLWAAGTKPGYFLVTFAPLIGGLWLILSLAPYRLQRVYAFLDPLNPKYADGVGMQQLQSLISLASGGMTGVGMGKSTQKFGFLPEPFTDTIYAILGEELGFLLGTLPVLALFGVLMWGALRIANHAPDQFGKLLAVGLAATFFFNTLIHVLVCVSWMPVTGQTLPFVSYGGTSLIINLFAVGVLLNIGKRRVES
jgi:cell division protein FtsW